MQVMHDDIIAALARVEIAVDAHPQLRRRSWHSAEPGDYRAQARARCIVDRDGFEIEISVLPRAGRKRRHTTISTNGHSYPTPAEAADELIRTLDFWAEAIK